MVLAGVDKLADEVEAGGREFGFVEAVDFGDGEGLRRGKVSMCSAFIARLGRRKSVP